MSQKQAAAVPGPGRRLIAGLCIAALLLLAAVWLVVEISIDRLVRAEAERSGRTAGTYLLSALPELPEIVTGGAPLPEEGLVDRLRAAGSIVRFRLFDTRARPIFDSSPPKDASAAATDPEGGALRAIALGQPVAQVPPGEDAEEARALGEIYLPILKEGAVAGALSITIDTTDSRAGLRRILWMILPLLVALIVAACAVPALLLMRRDRARVRDRLQEESRCELMQSRSEAARLASTDALTGLLNRAALACAFDDRRKLLSDRDMVLTLMLIDIDDFKAVNDADGHEQGDQVLRTLGEILAASTREGDAAGRLGGDEFLLILTAPRYQDPGPRLAGRLLARVAEEESFRGFDVPVSISIGVTAVWKATTSFPDALRQANLALHEAKRGSSGQVTLYEPAMAERHDRRKTVLHDVRAALDAGDVVPAYQPVVSLKDRRVVGLEVLARWRQRDGTLRDVADFPAAFEEPRLASLITARMIETAAADCAWLRAEGVPFGRLGVNVTEEQIADPNFTETLLDILLAHGLSPGTLIVELTETVLLSRREAAVLTTLERLENAGATIALDDFGTGFASLTHLRRFPVHQVKLDLSFISNIALEPEAHAITAAIISMAKQLGIRVVAEGVETAEIDSMLRNLGCDFGQGFFYARPAPLDEVVAVLRDGVAA